MQKSYIPRENIFFKEYTNGKEIWKDGVIDKRIRRLMYIIKEPKKTIKNITTRSGKGTLRIYI